MSLRQITSHPAKLHLLDFCLLTNGARARHSWLAWKKHIHLDDLDHGSFRIMSLVYKRLVSLGLDDPDLGRIKGIYRYQWTKNKLVFRGKGVLLQHFADASIPTLLLKGAALGQSVYSDPSTRTMHDLDLLVPISQAAAVIPLLQSRGWTAQHFAPEAIIQHLHACSFLHPQLGELDLHWHVFRSHCHPERTAELWQAAVDQSFEGAPTKFLCPADQFLHACEHGLHHSPSSSLQWLIDACFILRHNRTPFDWDRLLDQSSKFRLTLPVRHTLAFLQKRYDDVVPPRVIRALAKRAIPWTDRLEYTLTGRPDDAREGTLHELGISLCHHFRSHAGRPLLTAVQSLPEYLRLKHHFEQGPAVGLRHMGSFLLVGLGTQLRNLKRWVHVRTLGLVPVLHLGAKKLTSLTSGSHYPQERAYGQWYFWSTPRATLSLDLPAGHYGVAIDFPGFADCRNLQLRRPEFSLNGQTLPTSGVRWFWHGVWLTLPPSSCQPDGPQLLAWSILPLLPEGKDPRPLGLPFLQLHVYTKLN